MARVLLVSSDVVGERMAGPGVRSWEFAKALAPAHRVTLAAPPPLPSSPPGFEVVEAARSILARAGEAADLMVMQPLALELFPALRQARAARVIDLYDPSLLEGLELHADLPPAARLGRHRADVATLEGALRAGDLFLCASERQRHFWLGALATAGRINPLTYAGDPCLEKLIAVVPFGVPDQPPQRSGPGLRGVVNGIGDGDRIALWAGGIWNWFDPQTLVRAAGQASREVPNLKVVFMGTKHPNPGVPRMQAAVEARRLAQSLDLEGRHVFFLPGWVPYDRRADVLLDADMGVVLQRDTIEGRFAFRTRVLDHLWTGLPSVLTAGDPMAELVAGKRLGLVVPPGDVDAVAGALVRLALDRPFAEQCGRAASRQARAFRWSAVIRPLAEFCADPRPAADRTVDAAGAISSRPRLVALSRAWRIVRRDGVGAFAARALRYARRRLR